MANEGHGQHHIAVDGIQLRQTFYAIAENTHAADALAAQFGEVIGDMVSSTIILGHL